MDNTQHTREQSVGTMSRSMLIVMIFTMVSKVAGFLRETVLAANYGMNLYTDAYKAADNLTCIILSIVVTAMCTTLIPVYSTQLKQGQKQATRFINNLYTIGFIVSVVILLLTLLFMDPLTSFLTRNAEDPGTKALVTQLATVMMPMGIFVFLSRITSAYLQANFNFTVPAISQLVLNIVLIGSIMVSGGTNITYVAIGTVIGWALQFLVQLPSVRRTGLVYRPVLDFKEPGIRSVFVLILPVLVSSAFDQIYLTFDMQVAFGGAVGDPTALDYANRINTMVSSVLLTTVATVLYPNLVRHADDREKFMDNLGFGINLNLLIALPAIAAILVLSLPITRMVYQRGEFSDQDTIHTAVLLSCYCAGILGVGLRELCFRCFYAFKDTIVPTIVGVGVVVLNIGLNYALHPIFGAAGVAAATSISVSLSGVVLLVLLHFKRHVVNGRKMLQCLWKTAVSTGVMTALLLVLYRVLDLGTRTGSGLWMGLGITVIAGIAAYAVMLLILRTDELGMVIRMVKKKFRRG